MALRLGATRASYDFGRSSGRARSTNAIFEYLEIFHNRQRRHSALGMSTRCCTRTPSWRDSQPTRLHGTR
jgi:hypothetical protein